MSDVPANVTALLRQNSGQSVLSEDDISRIEAAIVNSPYLADVMSRAVESGNLKGFARSDNANEAGHYDRATGLIHLSPSTLHDPKRGPGQQGDYLTVTLGHETSHALRADVTHKASYELSFSVGASLREAAGNESYVDLTGPAKKYLQERRYNEALAEQTGLNALASRVRTENDGQFNEAEFTARAVTTSPCASKDGENPPALARGIQLSGAGFQNAKDPAAVEAVALCFYDPSGTLGRHGNLNYANYNGGTILETIAAEWHEADRYARMTGRAAPEVRLNLAELKLDVALMERNGLDLGGKSFGFTDTSNGQLNLATVRHTASPDKQDSPRTEITQASLGSDPAALLRADRAGHPDHGDFEAIRAKVSADGRWNDTQSSNIAASLLREQKADPLSQRIDSVVVGDTTALGTTNIFAVYSPHGNKEPHFLSAVDASKGAQESASQNLDQVNQINQQRARQLQQQDQQVDQVRSAQRTSP